MAKAESQAGTDRSSRGELMLITRATYMATETLDVYAGATLHQVLHSHLMDGEDGQDHTYVGTSIGAKLAVTDNLSVDASLGYDAFNHNYDNNINGRVGAVLLF